MDRMMLKIKKVRAQAGFYVPFTNRRLQPACFSQPRAAALAAKTVGCTSGW